jgi:hypothetical protein
MTQATVTSRTIAVEHIKISSERSFEEVRQKLEGTLRTPTSVVEGLADIPRTWPIRRS